MNSLISNRYIQTAYRKLLHQIGDRQAGTNVFSRDWDCCIVLDACRYDLMETVASDYESLQNLDSIWSVDSKTHAWLEKTVKGTSAETLERTAYVTGNPFSDYVLDDNPFGTLDEVWRYAWDDDLGTVRPRPITDRAIRIGRTSDFDRLLIHYMQPHVPFLDWEERQPLQMGNFGAEKQAVRDTWGRFRDGEVEEEDVWRAYRRNLKIALDDIELLLNNLDATETIITSDHGNGMGEWGIYGHPLHMPFEPLRKVPWIQTTARDQQTHTPEEYEATTDETSIEDRLAALGYK
ncbi:hypothetical protein HWV23_15530 [Natronomonas halophila]|uniref:hypothetical protein n=1 Tax=Natronomonas halophila TaxID=2747817 RepID=UPI0015B4CC08|nr:hypothetical protein [Natronomonas halophila]QLD87074.1 hypothetical protein HWV23_15530 [Natronomonas halophila]